MSFYLYYIKLLRSKTSIKLRYRLNAKLYGNIDLIYKNILTCQSPPATSTHYQRVHAWLTVYFCNRLAVSVSGWLAGGRAEPLPRAQRFSVYSAKSPRTVPGSKQMNVIISGIKKI